MSSRSKKAPLTLNTFLPYAEVWAQTFSKDKEKYLKGEITGAELCSRVILKVYQDVLQNKWINGERTLRDFNWSGDGSCYALDTLSQKRVRWLSDVAVSALLRWGRGDIQLKIFFEVPLAYEVLLLQSQGVRCVSLMIKEEEIRSFTHEERNFITFLIHDLVHAQLMTADFESYAHQTKFARWIKEEWILLSSSLTPSALHELEYMASDMNSHIVHLIKTFKSWVQRYKPEMLSRRDWLKSFGVSEQDNHKFLNLWTRLEETSVHQELIDLWASLSEEKNSNPEALRTHFRQHSLQERLWL